MVKNLYIKMVLCVYRSDKFIVSILVQNKILISFSPSIFPILPIPNSFCRLHFSTNLFPFHILPPSPSAGVQAEGDAGNALRGHLARWFHCRPGYRLLADQGHHVRRRLGRRAVPLQVCLNHLYSHTVFIVIIKVRFTHSLPASPSKHTYKQLLEFLG